MMSQILTFSKRLLKTPFGKTFFVFVLFQLIFLAITKIVPFQSNVFKIVFHHGIENTQTAFLMFSVYLLILVNTIIFIVDAMKPVSCISNLDDECRPKVRKQFARFNTLLIISTFLAGIMAFMIARELIYGMSYDGFPSVLKFSEVVSISIYALFLYADLCCLKACEIALESDISATEFSNFQAEVKNYALACDGPGLFGIVLITLMSFTLHGEWAGIYWQGFVTGAIGLHMAFSQSALAFLSTNGVK